MLTRFRASVVSFVLHHSWLPCTPLQTVNFLPRPSTSTFNVQLRGHCRHRNCFHFRTSHLPQIVLVYLNVRLSPDLAYCTFLDTTDYLSYWPGDILWTMSLDALLNLMRLHGMMYDNLSKTDAHLAVVRHLSSAACRLYARRSVSSIPLACLDFIVLYVLR